MYAIISGGVLLALCDKPRYVRNNEASGAYVEAEEAQAEGISVNGDLYNIGGGSAIPDAPQAVVTARVQSSASSALWAAWASAHTASRTLLPRCSRMAPSSLLTSSG